MSQWNRNTIRLNCTYTWRTMPEFHFLDMSKFPISSHARISHCFFRISQQPNHTGRLHKMWTTINNNYPFFQGLTIILWKFLFLIILSKGLKLIRAVCFEVEIKSSPVSQSSIAGVNYIVLLIATAIVNAQMNGVIPSVQSFAALPYSQVRFRWMSLKLPLLFCSYTGNVSLRDSTG